MRLTGACELADIRILLPALTALIVGCAGLHESPDYIRHRYSHLSEPYDRNDVLYFDAMFDSNYPDKVPAAEEKRMEWLSGWLEQLHMCPEGYEVLSRRLFDAFEYNPGRYDVRYEVRCTTGT